jgi:galactokinase
VGGDGPCWSARLDVTTNRLDGDALRIFAPGRVNLIGDHTDYMGGLVFPMAIDRGITLTGHPGGSRLEVYSAYEDRTARVELPVLDPMRATPPWARLLAGVAAEMGAIEGFAGALSSDLPVAGLSSSAAVEVATALALGHVGPPLAIAQLCQAAEHRAIGVPCGIMDQLTSAAGVAGHALLIDCHSLEITSCPLPEDVDVVIVQSGEHRELINSAYATRRAECEAAQKIIGPLRLASPSDTEAIDDPTLRARARHVVTENLRVRAFAEALAHRDYTQAGRLMVESHTSLGADFEVSTPTLDALVDALVDTPGVHGARLTGAGFGGAVVALTGPGALQIGFVATASAGARIA